jgi:hypothetical protein
MLAVGLIQTAGSLGAAGPYNVLLANFKTNFTRNWNLLQNGVLERLRGTQTHNGLGLDLDLLAGLGIAAQAGFAMGLYHAADVGDYEFSGRALRFFYREFEKFIKKKYRVLF